MQPFFLFSFLLACEVGTKGAKTRQDNAKTKERQMKRAVWTGCNGQWLLYNHNAKGGHIKTSTQGFDKNT